MNLMHAGFLLAGLAAMTLPIWIHLLLRPRAPLMEIGSTRFISQVVQQSKRRRWIRRWLVLALRCLAVLLLGLLFARPYLPEVPVDGSTREVAVLIDRSASMSARHDDGRSAFDQAKRQAAKFLSEQGDQARVHLGLFDASGVQSVSSADLSKLDASATAGSYVKPLQWAADRLGGSIRKDRTLLILSDYQRAPLDGAADLLFPADVPVEILDTGPAVSGNLAVLDVQPTQTELRPKHPIAISIWISNQSPFPISALKLSLELQGPDQTVKQQAVVDLEGEQRRSVVMELPITTSGIYHGTVSIQGDDAFAWDDQRYVAFEVTYPDRVLLVDGQSSDNTYENETYFLEKALRLQTAVGSGPPRTFEVERLIWDRGKGFPDLGGFRLIVLANIGRLSKSDADRMRQFLERGGNLVIFAGDRTSAAVLQTLRQSQLTGKLEFQPPRDVQLRVTDFDRENPALRLFAEPHRGDLRRLTVHRILPIVDKAGEFEVLMQAGASPLIVSRKMGTGRLTFVATTADRQWNDWPQNRLYVPLVRQLAAWLTGRFEPLRPVQSLTIRDAQQAPGIEDDLAGVVVQNVAASESDIGKLDEDAFRAKLGLQRAAAEDAPVGHQEFAPEGASRSDEKWPWVVWGLLGLLSAELLLSSRTPE
ncbi:BatA domain-containing protein [Roseiconus nitratireducens]|nr:BatA domain-containing protein [Roseiconus nitratireducens]